MKLWTIFISLKIIEVCMFSFIPYFLSYTLEKEIGVTTKTKLLKHWFQGLVIIGLLSLFTFLIIDIIKLLIFILPRFIDLNWQWAKSICEHVF